MLAISRKVGQSFVVGDNVRVIIGKTRGNTTKVYIEAPRNVPVRRSELPAQEAKA